MKQKVFVIIAAICIGCLLIATLVSAKRARFFQNDAEKPDATEDVTTSQVESDPADALDYVEYTGQAHEGTCIAYRGKGANAGYVVVIDAGHQLHAMSEQEPIGPGAEQTKAKVTGGTQGSFSGLAEYELNLRVALALRDALVAQGYTVVMVRERNDVEISNAERAQLANRVKADVNLRIHANGDTDAAKKGALTICQTAQNPYNGDLYRESRALSDAVLQAFCASTGMVQGNVWETDTMSGINWASVPTTIVEMGYMTNQEDDAAMAAAGFAQRAAEGLAQGIADYLAQRTVIEPETSAPEQVTEQVTEPDAGYTINYALEEELGCTFEQANMTVETTATVWVRTEPSTRGGETTTVNIATGAGKRFTCIGVSEHWYRILIDGKVYYISAAYCKAVDA